MTRRFYTLLDFLTAGEALHDDVHGVYTSGLFVPDCASCLPLDELTPGRLRQKLRPPPYRDGRLCAENARYSSRTTIEDTCSSAHLEAHGRLLAVPGLCEGERQDS